MRLVDRARRGVLRRSVSAFALVPRALPVKFFGSSTIDAAGGSLSEISFGARITGSIAGNVLTVTAMTHSEGTTAGKGGVMGISVGHGLVRKSSNDAPFVNANTTILAQLSGTAGGVGTYSVSATPDIASTDLVTGPLTDPAMRFSIAGWLGQRTQPVVLQTYHTGGVATGTAVYNEGYAGSTPTEIKDRALAEFQAGKLNGAVVFYYTGVNGTESYQDAEVERFNILRQIPAGLPADQLQIFGSTNIYGGGRLEHRLIARRWQSFLRGERGAPALNRRRAYADLSFPLYAYPRAGLTTADVRRLETMDMPAVMQSFDDVHPNGLGNSIIGAEVEKAVEAFSGGPVHIPFMEYPAVFASGPGVYLRDLYWSGPTGTAADLANTVFTCETPGFSVAVVGDAIRLSLTGAAPKADFTDVVVRIKKLGFPVRRGTVRISVTSRTGTAPALVKITNGVSLQGYKDTSQTGRYNVAASDKFSMVWIGQFLDDDGQRPDRAAGPSNRTQRIMSGGSATLSRAATGAYSFICASTTSGNAWQGTAGTGFRLADHGLHAVFFEFDGAAGIANAWFSGGRLLSTGATYAGSGPVAIGRPGGTVAMLAGAAVPSLFSLNATDPDFFQGIKGLLWCATQRIDWSVQANRDLFFNDPTAGVGLGGQPSLRDLGTADGTVLGVSPYLYLPGDAAELLEGATDAFNGERGGYGMKNHGTGGSLYVDRNALYGRMTTL